MLMGSAIIERMEYIKIGTIINTHGIKGELKIRSCSDFDDERYAKGATVYIYSCEAYLPFTVATYRVHKGFPLVSFEGCGNINDVEKYKTCDVFVKDTDRRPLKDGRHYVSDLIGMTVKSSDGEVIGTVKDIEDTCGAQRNMRVEREGQNDVLIPYVPAFIKYVDEYSHAIVINVIEGLL